MATPPPALRPTGLEDLPLDILEYLCLAFLPPAAFAALLATSPALRCALQPSEACWKRVAADVFGADAAAKHGPLSTTELAAAGRAVIVTGGGVDPLADLPPARRDWRDWHDLQHAAVVLFGCLAQPVPCTAAAEEQGRALAALAAGRGELPPGGPPLGRAVDAFASSAFAWAARAAPVNCDSYREVVARYDAAVGRYGADGARAARVWGRLERFLADAAPTVADTLMAGWRAGPPPAAVDPAVRLCPAVAASAALHLGQVTTGGSTAAWVRSRLVGLVEGEGEGVWEGGGDLTSDVVRAAIHRRRLAAECAGVAGVVTVYDQLHSGFLHPLWCHDAGLEADRWAEVGMPSALSAETPAERFRPPAFQWGPRPDEFCTFVGVTPGPGGAGTCVGAPLDPAALRPLLVPALGTALDGLAPPAAQRGRSLFVCLRTGAVYGRAAAIMPRHTTQGGPAYGVRRVEVPSAWALVRGDAGRGLLGWLEELAARQEAGLYGAASASALLTPHAWETEAARVRRVRAATAATEACLDGFPG